MTIRDFIRTNKSEIDRSITQAQTRYDKPGFKRNITLNDEERKLWILNDEGLYNWARSEGVRI